MNHLRTYKAYSMREALDAVKQDLGADAVILSTRTLRQGGFLGIGARTVVEVTATPAEPKPRPKPAAPKAGTKTNGARLAAAGRAYQQSTSSNEPAASAPATNGGGLNGSATHGGATDADRRRTQRLAQALAAAHERQARERAPEASPPPAITPAPAAPAAPVAEPAPEEPVAPPAPVARRFVLRPAEEGGAAEPSRPAAPTAAPSTPSRAASTPSNGSRRPARLFDEEESPAPVAPPRTAPDQEMQDELAAIRAMVGQVLQRQGQPSNGAPTPTMPKALFEMYLKLIGQDLSTELADRIINEARDTLTTGELDSSDKVRDAVRDRLTHYVPIAPEPVSRSSPDGRPLTIALIGPTGVGKTTTIAKLAASFKLRHQRKVGLVTSDTYRIAAVDQLRTYANIIGLPLEVVITPADMKQAIHKLSGCDVILIDTAGRSQNDSSKIEELSEFVAAASPHEVHLVLSSTASEKVLLREADSFSAVGYDKIVLTKLDEAVSFGMLINVMRTIGKRLSFVTTGQEVPDHIELGDAERLAEFILTGALTPESA